MLSSSQNCMLKTRNYITTIQAQFYNEIINKRNMGNNIKMEDVLRHLAHKERHIFDLASFLKNKCENTPNYTLLLGAGCSVTSGICTGVDLVNIWKKEIYETEKQGDISEEDFWSVQFPWYDQRNPYSSLFQKKYDLPRQRRIFVENEVAGKNPAIGYAYLVKLIESNYFNTVFTTNFDDLINEAFYRFSSKRPIVCAHDSSISSITVTSKRPKIIKLHGDYLFDDIKSTLRETESLNDNMKAKFIEFAKDHGLVVVGYAGNDRSIMDILSMLLQKEDYFKHGIYWCIRKGDANISDELRQLLWKDRVFYVKVDGFDELMAELNLRLNDGKLPIEDELLSYKKQKKMIEDLTDKRYFSEATKANNIIEKDMRRLSKNISKNIINDFFDIVNKRNSNIKSNAEPNRRNGLKALTDEERRKLDDIQDLLEEGRKEEAESIITKTLSETTGSTQFVFYLYDMMTTILRSVPGKEKLLQDAFDKMIELNPNCEENYIKAFRFIDDYKLSVDYLNRAISLFPNDIYLYNEKASYLINERLDLWENNSLQEIFAEIKEAIDKSLEINNTPYNKAWLIKCDYLKKINEKDIDGSKLEIQNVVNTFSHVKSQYLSIAYERYYKLLDIEEDECEKKLKDLYTYFQKADDLAFVEVCAISRLNFYMKQGKIKDFEEFVQDYEKEYIPSEDFEFNKAVAYVKHFAKFEKAEDIINSAKKSKRWRNLMFDYFCETNQKERAEKLLNRYFSNDIYKKVRYYSMCDDNKIIELLESYWESNPHMISDISMYACACLKHGQEAKAYKLCKKYYDNPDYFDGVLYINYFLADKKYNKKDNRSKIQNKIINKKELYPQIVMAAAYALVNDRDNMYSCLNVAIKENVLFKFDIVKWPVFEKYVNEDKFKKIADVKDLLKFEKKIENF